MKIEIKLTMSENEKAKVKVLEKAIGAEFKPISEMKGRWGYLKDRNISIVEQCFIDAIDIIVALVPKIKSLVTFLKSFFPIIKMAGKTYSQKWFEDTVVNTETCSTSEPIPDSIPKAEQQKVEPAHEPKVESIPKAKQSKSKSKYIPSKSKPKTK